LIREAAVYVVVMMLPLVFAAMVWPARRVWALRAVEVLVALILAKFAIVSILALAAAALEHSGGSLIVRALAGLVLVLLGAFAPWVLLRLLPLAEVASAAAGHVRDHAQNRIANDVAVGRQGVATVSDGVSALIERVRSFEADAADPADQSAAQITAQLKAADAAETPRATPGAGAGSSDDTTPPWAAPSGPSAADPAESGESPPARHSEDQPARPAPLDGPTPEDPSPPTDDDHPRLPPADPEEGQR
jgi:hypothetical protein